MNRIAMARRKSPLLLAIGVVAVVAVVATVLGVQSPSPPASASPPTNASPVESGHGAADEADGVVPDGVTVRDDTTPAVGNLAPGLLKALRRAATDASREGVTFYVNSGWRSPEYQNRLLGEAVSKYGSEAEAAQWVATADTSPHVSGDAVDLGRSEATAWLSEHGAAYGLCQIYGNEPWHYELRSEAADHGCPDLYANPTEDPRMQK
ncbi:M15 family metallopeptidase [Streptomyces sp. NPDC002754]